MFFLFATLFKRFEKKFEVSNSNIFDLDLPAQPTPELIEKFKKEIELNSKPEKTKKQIIDEMVIEYSDTNSGEESIDEDEIFDFDSSDEEYREAKTDQEKNKLVSSLAQSIQSKQKVYENKVEMARIKAEQAMRAINPIESTNKGKLTLFLFTSSKFTIFF